MSKKGDKFTFKVTVIGDGAVGKTSLIKKFTKGNFQEEYIQTIGAQFSKYIEDIKEDRCKLFFWDIAGQDTFHFLRPAFYKASVAAIIVYSLEDIDSGKESLKHVPKWHSEITKFCGDIPIVLFGNKVDLVDEKELTDEKISKLREKKDFLGYYRTSAKTGQGVHEAFQAIIKELYS
ncbi:MAG: GTP-binding protein, partial [Candidatus Lokiarchaeota archaeon]|nr:GTP-binding protein [Candidatus Lokiarchaeota archaeon]